MHERTSRDTTIEFVAELCEPVGPFVFAGHGGRIARVRHEIQEQSGDLIEGTFRADERVREIRRAWVDGVSLPTAIDVLLDLFAAPPPEALTSTTSTTTVLPS